MRKARTSHREVGVKPLACQPRHAYQDVLRQALDVGPQSVPMHWTTAVSIAEFYPDGHASVKLVNDTSHLS